MTERRLPQTAVENLVEDLASKANADLSNLDATGQAKFDAKANISLTNTPYTTNRILEIPQDIKLELNNGTLTLKAGSKVYVPNGFESDGTTPKFDVRIIENDIVDNNSGHNNTELLTVRYDGGISGGWLFWFIPEYIYSGATAPTVTSTYAYWYDTANNLMKWTGNNGSTWDSGSSLPIALGKTNSSGVTTSLDQVFNGFGYIGSTVFALPNIKVQGAFGVNEDGTYKLKTFITDRVLTVSFDSTVSSRYEFGFDINENGTITYFGAYAEEIKTSEKQPSGINFIWWNPIKGESRYVDLSGIAADTLTCSPRLGRVNVSGGRIESMVKNSPDSIVTSNALNFSQAGRSYLSGLGMPSNRYIDLTLGASGTTYTAPANGWFRLVKKSTAVGQSIQFNPQELYRGRENSDAWMYQVSSVTNQTLTITLPVLKGQKTWCYYNASGETVVFDFIYAEGENNV